MRLSRYLVCVGMCASVATMTVAHECPEPLPITLGPDGIFYWDSDDVAEDTMIEPLLPAIPAPEWMAWQSLYTGLSDHRAALQRRASLTDAEFHIVSEQGAIFVRELELIDEQSRREISERYGPEFPYQIFGSDLGLPPEFDEDEPYLPPFTRDGRPLQLAMEEDGYTEELDSRKYAAYRAHWDALAETIGLYKLIGVEAYVERELATYINVMPAGVPPMELPPLLREFVEFLKTRPIEEQVR